MQKKTPTFAAEKSKRIVLLMALSHGVMVALQFLVLSV